MEKTAWIVSDSISSPLGYTTTRNFERVLAGDSGIATVSDMSLSPYEFIAARITSDFAAGPLTRSEQLIDRAVSDALQGLTLPAGRTVFILSTTKGNISFLEEGSADHPRLHLHHLAQFMAQRFGFEHSLVISNACVSGVMALLVARRMILSGMYDHAVVVGVDVLSRFVVSGFQILQAMSPERCRPFDADRKGINLGEAAAAIVVSSDALLAGKKATVCIPGGATTNDANHISGPSRTGAELAQAIRQSLQEAGLKPEAIGYVSAHGTATLYNDEMEAKAFGIAGVADKPTHSLKGYFGHTLGAAGVLEVALNVESLKRGHLVASAGYVNHGVSQPLNVIKEHRPMEVTTCLKTASGFGGCNAAIILNRIN